MNIEIIPKNEYAVDSVKIADIATATGLNTKLVEILVARGISTEEAIDRFLHPSVEMFYDPFLMKGMREAVARINQAIENGEKIVIFGDYDADGVCASAILSLYLSSRGLDVLVHIPNRIGEGYGLNIDSLSKIIENEMPDLILTCDCGISGANEVSFVLDLGVDIIVTDHHEISGPIPECVVVNPKQEDCNYPYNMLCGAGVALKLIEALSDRKTMLEYSDLACVATIADLVPLTDENRLIVQFGLKKINERKNIGLRMLFDSLKLENLTSADIAYKIAPRINAAGRMGDAYRAFELLTLTDRGAIKRIVDEIENDNSRRKSICDEMYDEAVGDIAFEDIINNRAIILSHPDWEKGITGIVAARLASDFNRPSFILVRSGDTYKGTSRSIEGINIHELLTYCKDCLIEFGGHAQAAGFSIAPDKIDEFKQKANEFLRRFTDEYFYPKASYDLKISVNDINFEFVHSLDLLEPTGNSNPKPLFLIDVNEAKVAPCKNNQNHISVTVGSLQMFAFNYARQSYQLLTDSKKEMLVELQTSSYSPRQIKGIIKACSPSELYINDAVANGYNYSLLKYLPKDNPKYELYSEEDLAKFTDKIYGTLFVACSRKSYEVFKKKHNGIRFHEFSYPSSKNNFSRIIVAPDLEQLSLYSYDRIVFLDAPLNSGVVSFINSKTKATVYLPNECEGKYEVTTDRKVFTTVFSVLKENQNYTSSSAFAYWRNAFMSGEIGFNQFLFCVNVFAELKFIIVNDSPYYIRINNGVRAELTQSKIYNLVLRGEEQ